MATTTKAKTAARSSATRYIAIDVHCQFCEGGVIDSLGRECGQFQVATSIPTLLEAIEKVPRPRTVVIEEGPLADWLQRHLAPHVDEMIVCDPYRNALIAKEGDKSDPIDWRKLAHLCRGGYVKAVHQRQSLARSMLKQHVQVYHDRVRHRVSEANKILWRVRRLGVFVTEADLKDDSRRQAMLDRLPGGRQQNRRRKDGEGKDNGKGTADGKDKDNSKGKGNGKAADDESRSVIRQDVELLLKGYDLAAEQVTELRRRLVTLGKQEPMIRAFCELPGVSWVRAASFFVMVDTPFRFASKQKLWKYAGIGLERHQSGNGPVRLRVPRRCNRVLKNVLLGAAKSAAASKDNVLADQYQRWLDAKCSPRIARRNLARSLATVMWGMWKSGSVFEPTMIGPAPAAIA
jgi:transposase